MKLKLFFAVCAAMFLTACPKTTPDKRIVKAIAQSYVTEFKKDQARYDCYVRGFDYTTDADDKVVCQQTTPDKAAYKSDARRIRDKVGADYIRVIDGNYEVFVDDLQNRRATTNILFDITELGVGTAIGITNGERAIQILGVALTAFQGGRKSIDQNFYQRQSTPILITKMDTSRDRTLSAIIQKKDKFDVEKYSLEDILGDVIKYFWAGTLTRGFVELAKDSSIQAKEAENELKVLTGVEIDPIPTVQQAEVSDEITTQRVSLAKQFLDAESITVAAEKTAAVNKITAKYERLWTDVQANDALKPTFSEISTEPTYKAIIDKINTDNVQPSRKELNILFARFLSKIVEKDKAAKDTKLEKAFLDLVTKANQ